MGPAQNVTVGVILSDATYIFWYQPKTYKLHIPDESSTSTSDVTYNVTGMNDYDYYSEDGDTTVAQLPNDFASSGSQKSGGNSAPTNAVDPGSDTKNDTNIATNSTNATENTNSTSDSRVDNGTANSSVVVINGTALNISDFIGKSRVPFHLAKLKYFVVDVLDSEGITLK